MCGVGIVCVVPLLPAEDGKRSFDSRREWWHLYRVRARACSTHGKAQQAAVVVMRSSTVSAHQQSRFMLFSLWSSRTEKKCEGFLYIYSRPPL